VTRPRTVGAFVRAHRARWERLEVLTEQAAAGRLALAEVEELDRIYRRAAGDLAYARVAFPGSDAEGYLAQVLARAYAALYRPPRRGLSAVVALYRVEAPAVVRAHAGALGVAVAFLAAGIAGGAAAVAWDADAAELLVPEAIRRSVDAGRMWTEGLLSAAPGITGSALSHNNLTVAALAFAAGLTGGIGTAALLLANGLVLGAVAAYAVRGGVGEPFFTFVAAHGPAELSALLLAAQGGFVLGAALVAPGEWPRAAAVQAAARRGARLLAVAVPVLLGVALVEASVSPSAAIPLAAKALLGGGLAAGLWGWLGWAGRRPAASS
jgi:uncharacterized membrane protein SpoIIM required for sporulation